MDNTDDNFEEYVRPPDDIKSEQLIAYKRNDYEREIDEAIYLSIQEFNQKININDEFEKELINKYFEENKKRKNLFSKLLFDLNKISKFDNEIKDIYEIIEPIIESYCSQFIETCEFDKNTYEKIFKILGKIRTDKNAIELLKTIILNK
jgi:hypothetical protein